jgi:cyclase
MENVRFIARLDIKGFKLIKGINLEGLRVIGDPQAFANDYYLNGIDELLYIDSVATLYGRNHLTEIVRETAKNIFVPLTVGGGIRTITNAEELLRNGADKIAVNTGAVVNPRLIADIARTFGSQCMVLSVEAKKIGECRWEVFTHNGRERTGLDVVDWIKKAVDLGAGEILLTSIDFEGTRKGFDLLLVKSVARDLRVPLIASGGMGKPQDLVDVVNLGGADAVAMADILHYRRATLPQLRTYASEAGLKVRKNVKY